MHVTAPQAMNRVAVSAGTGMTELNPLSVEVPGVLDFISDDRVNVETPWGDVPMRILLFRDDNGDERRLFLLHRHHGKEGRTTPPHQIEHRANITAVKSCQAEVLLSLTSVGTLNKDLSPGMVGIVNQYIDFTGRVWTFHDDDAAHASVTFPFNPSIVGELESVLSGFNGPVPLNPEQRETYAMMTGPQFESAAEVEALHRLGTTIVGMTLVPEVKLAAEASLPIAALALSSNWGAGFDPDDPTAEIDHYSVSDQASEMENVVVACIRHLLLVDFDEEVAIDG